MGGACLAFLVVGEDKPELFRGLKIGGEGRAGATRVGVAGFEFFSNESEVLSFGLGN